MFMLVINILFFSSQRGALFVPHHETVCDFPIVARKNFVMPLQPCYLIKFNINIDQIIAEIVRKIVLLLL